MRFAIPVLTAILTLPIAGLAAADDVNDLNGDGYDDLVVGARGETEPGFKFLGAAYVYLGGDRAVHLEKSDLTYHSKINRIGERHSGASFGWSLELDDLDQDGLADLLVGVPAGRLANANPGDRSGVLDLFRGTLQGLVGEYEVALGPIPSHPGLLGYDVGVGDFNGDGAADIVAGAPGHTLGETMSGALAHYYTLPGALVPGQQLPTYATNGAFILGQFGGATNEADDDLGIALEVADFDGDGRSDVAVGARSDVRAGVDSGQVFVFGGQSGVPRTQGRQILHSQDIDGGQSGEAFGSSLAAGDFDGDGNLDLAVGAPEKNVQGEQGVGQVYVFQGDGGGMLADGYALNPSDSSAAGGDQFGFAMVSADFDQDGFDDLVVGAPGGRLPVSDVILREPIPIRLGSFSRVSSRPTLVSLAPTSGDRSAVSGPRDEPFWPEGRNRVDPPFGDLYPDPVRRPRGGVIYYYAGSPSGLVLIDRYDQAPLGTNSRFDAFGSALATADYNGDGFADLAVGAPSFHEEESEATESPRRGEVFIFYSGEALRPPAPTGHWLFPVRRQPVPEVLVMQQRILAPSSSGTGTLFGDALSR